MRIHQPYGSKERLFEMMKNVNNLTEEVLPKDQREEIVNDFVIFVTQKINLKGEAPNISLSYDDDNAQEMKSFGRYSPETNEILVVAVNRNLADILRTIAHEIIHLKQDEEGKLKPDSGETGSAEENEANALAGVFMRDYGKANPIIFEIKQQKNETI